MHHLNTVCRMRQRPRGCIDVLLKLQTRTLKVFDSAGLLLAAGSSITEAQNDVNKCNEKCERVLGGHGNATTCLPSFVSEL